MKVRLFFIILFLAVDAREFSDEEYYELPRLFHLDDQQQCLSGREGLYCLGTFHYTPAGGSDSVYDLMKEYSSDPHHFNRTLIHRGYCVSSRCPDLNGSHTVRFQGCAERIGQQVLPIADQPGRNLLQTSDQSGKLLQTFDQPERMKTSLVELLYCHTVVDAHEKVPLDTAKLVLLVVISAVVLLNLIGTVYEVRSKKAEKIQLLTVWSVRENWKQLTSSSKEAARSPLAALHGTKVAITLCTCLSHSALLHFMIYSYNPRTLEQIIAHPLSMIVQNSTAMEQMLFVISGFLLSRQLQHQKGEPVRVGAAVYVIAKRIFRLLPVFVLVVSFAATWWPAMGSGPLWASVNAESRICRDKFWTHLFFVNNLVEPEKLCVLSTWYMAVDFQLHVISTIILVVLTHLRIPKLTALVVIFIGSALLNAGLAYAFNWSSMLYLTTSPEKLRTLFRGDPSFASLYMSPWGNLPVCVLGLIAGHLVSGAEAHSSHLDVVKLKFLRWLASPVLTVPAMMGSWVAVGFWLQHVKSRLYVAAYVAVERSIFQVCCLLSFVLASAVRGFVMSLLSWRGWLVLSRLSYPVMLLHWLVNVYMVSSTPQPLTASILDIGVHGYITAFYSFLLAIPVTVLLEMPMKKLFDAITS